MKKEKERPSHLTDEEQQSLTIGLNRLGFGPLTEVAVSQAAKLPAIDPVQLERRALRRKAAR